MHQSGREAKGLLGLLILTAIFGCVFLSIHFVYHSPWYLGQLLVNSGNINHRSTPRGSRWAFVTEPLKLTWPVGVLLILHFATIGMALEMLNPKPIV